MCPWISRAEHLKASARQSERANFPSIDVAPQVCDHTRGIELDDEQVAGQGRRCFSIPGSSVGNFEPEQAVDFMQAMRAKHR